MTAELKAMLNAMKTASINPADYAGAMFDVVFDIITADTYVAGVATKLVDGERVDPAEAAYVSRPLLKGSAWLYEGQEFDLSQHPAAFKAAEAVERTRAICARILSGT
jgi:hypothetical protein